MKQATNKAIKKASQVSALYCNINDKQITIDRIGNNGTRGVLNSPFPGIPFSFRNFINPYGNIIK